MFALLEKPRQLVRFVADWDGPTIVSGAVTDLPRCCRMVAPTTERDRLDALITPVVAEAINRGMRIAQALYTTKGRRGFHILQTQIRFGNKRAGEASGDLMPSQIIEGAVLEALRRAAEKYDANHHLKTGGRPATFLTFADQWIAQYVRNATRGQDRYHKQFTTGQLKFVSEYKLTGHRPRRSKLWFGDQPQPQWTSTRRELSADPNAERRAARVVKYPIRAKGNTHPGTRRMHDYGAVDARLDRAANPRLEVDVCKLPDKLQQRVCRLYYGTERCSVATIAQRLRITTAQVQTELAAAVKWLGRAPGAWKESSKKFPGAAVCRNIRVQESSSPAPNRAAPPTQLPPPVPTNAAGQ
ncbi:MAG TPA: hypothetical protein VEK08_15185 [Planctomycetota bacterium]|nr:hypothetical protein [Planctomycetota bacterium]